MRTRVNVTSNGYELTPFGDIDFNQLFNTIGTVVGKVTEVVGQATKGATPVIQSITGTQQQAAPPAATPQVVYVPTPQTSGQVPVQQDNKLLLIGGGAVALILVLALTRR